MHMKEHLNEDVALLRFTSAARSWKAEEPGF